jgi:hypothetical protein
MTEFDNSDAGGQTDVDGHVITIHRIEILSQEQSGIGGWNWQARQRVIR